MSYVLKGLNPENPKQAHLFYDMFSSACFGEKRHPQIVMKELAEKCHFKILDSCPQSLFDVWSFWIEFDEIPKLPEYFREVKWIPMGEA